jgi:hypothetical protein
VARSLPSCSLVVGAQGTVEDLPLVSFGTLTSPKRIRSPPCRGTWPEYRGSARSSRISRSTPSLMTRKGNDRGQLGKMGTRHAHVNSARGRGRHNARVRQHSPPRGHHEGGGQLFVGIRALFRHLRAHYCSRSLLASAVKMTSTQCAEVIYVPVVSMSSGGKHDRPAAAAATEVAVDVRRLVRGLGRAQVAICTREICNLRNEG